MTMSAPVLPLELFIPIIECFGEIRDEIHQPEISDLIHLSELQQCSLVCKYFARLCQPYIFSIASIAFRGSGAHNLLHLMEIIGRRPSFKSHIRFLTLDLWVYGQCDISEADFKRCEKLLLDFPNLHSLIFLFGINYAADVEELDLIPSAQIEALRHQLVDKYVLAPKSRLKSLRLERYDRALPFNQLISSPHLRNLILGSTPLLFPSEYTNDTGGLKIFEYVDIDPLESFPLQSLLSLPALETLKLIVRGLEYGQPNITQSPSFDLRKLTLRLSTPDPSRSVSLSRFIKFFKSQAQARNRNPFDLLDTLDIVVSSLDDLHEVDTLLRLTPALKSFAFRAEFAEASFPPLLLDDHIRNTFPNLTKLRLSFKGLSFSSYMTFMDDLAAFFISISGVNTLTYIDLHLKSALLDNLPPAQEPWTRLDDLLSSREAFRDLSRIKVYLEFTAAAGSIEDGSDEWYELDLCLDFFIQYAMTKLNKKRGYDLTGDVWLSIAPE